MPPTRYGASWCAGLPRNHEPAGIAQPQAAGVRAMPGLRHGIPGQSRSALVLEGLRVGRKAPCQGRTPKSVRPRRRSGHDWLRGIRAAADSGLRGLWRPIPSWVPPPCHDMQRGVSGLVAAQEQRPGGSPSASRSRRRYARA
jgi:hypothetical protein